MKALILIIILLSATVARCQVKFDSSKIDKILFNSNFGNNIPIIDTQITKITESIDKNINCIVDSLFRYKPLKYTLVRGYAIEIRTLVDKQKSLELILSDTSFNYSTFWKKFNGDTIAFLSNATIQHDFGLYYPDYRLPVEISFINPWQAVDVGKLKNMLFYNDNLNTIVDSVCRKIGRDSRLNFYKYLSANYDYFSMEHKRFEPKSIGIVTITLSPDNHSYAELDIYGSHYLLTFDKNDSWKVVEIKELWTY